MALGLVLGKTIGLTVGVAIAVRLGLSVLPAGVRWAHVVGVGAVAGIGFTVSLFIAGLAYADPVLLDASKIGVLGGSVVAAVIGVAALLVVARGSAPPVSPGACPPAPRRRRGTCRLGLGSTPSRRPAGQLTLSSRLNHTTVLTRSVRSWGSE